MSKVISFKVEDSVYEKLKSLDVSFAEIFNPIASLVAEKINGKCGIPTSIPNNIVDTYGIIDDIDLLVDQLLERKGFYK